MRWATRELAHFDRVASAWLILRFVDTEAEFSFLPNDQAASEGDMGFGIPGGRFGAHDGASSTFAKIVAAFAPEDDALRAMAAIVDVSVKKVLSGDAISGDPAAAPLTATILGLTEGIMLNSPSDMDCVRSSLPLYDALYTRLHAQTLIEKRAPSPPASLLEQTILLSETVRRCRAEGQWYGELLQTIGHLDEVVQR